MRAGSFLLVFLLGASSFAQEKPKPPLLSAADQKRVDDAIAKGTAFLKGQSAVDPKGTHATELLLWTLVHAGVRAGDAKFDELFRTMMDEPLSLTYRVSLQAMILEELDRVRHQKRIFHCAQFLIDNQCRNGQWYYGEPTTLVDPPSDDVATGVKNFGDPGPGQMPQGGWCYGGRAHGHKPYGTMTAGAVGSLAICGFLLGEKNPRREIAVLRG